MRNIRFAFALLTATLCGGCLLPGEGSREITVAPSSMLISYQEQFDEAYAGPSNDDGFDLVLVRRFSEESLDVGRRVYPLRPNQIAQVIHVHVAWRPQRGAKSNFPAATNSTIDWYVVIDPTAQTPSYAKYSGIGFVALELGGDSSLFDLRDILVRPEQIVGNATDPIGASRLSGTIRARNNQQQVQNILSRLSQAIAAKDAAETQSTATKSAEPEGMPPARRQEP